MARNEAKAAIAAADLTSYFRSIGEEGLLTADDERRLAAAIALGEEDARSRIITANLRLVVTIARDYLGRGMSLEDLIGEGNLGLIRAAREFDPSFGVRFSTYASYWIKQAIRQALISTAATIRVPAHMIGLLNKWRKAERSMSRDLGRSPTFVEVADHLALSERQRSMVEDAWRAGRLKLEGSSAARDDYWSPDDSVDPSNGPAAEPEAEDDRTELIRRMDVLDERERMVLTCRYGLRGGEPLKLKEIGERLGCTREWVRKLEKRAIRKLAEAAAVC